VCLPGWQAGDRNRQPKRAKRPHSKFSDRKALDGPVMRPTTPLAVENGVGKLAAKARQMPASGKRAWRTPNPNLSLPDREVGQGLFFGCDTAQSGAVFDVRFSTKNLAVSEHLVKILYILD
jgi:hypothetical protein